MAVRSKADAALFRSKARSMYFSNETVDWFLENSSAAQMGCVADLLDRELSARERNKRERLFRRARFPQVKSFDGCDWSQVGLPDGYTREELVSLDFLDAAQDFVSYGRPAGARRTWR